MEEDKNIEYEITIDDLASCLCSNVKDDIKTFEDLINIESALNRELYIGDIDAGLGSTIDGYIRYWNSVDERNNVEIEDREPIKIYIDSNGGCLSDTFTMIDAIRMSKTPVWTIVTGCAYSGGFFTSIAGHKRFAYPHASFMMHEGATSTGGDAHKFVNYTQFYKKELNQLKRHVLNCTNITNEKYEEIKRDDFWLDSQEAFEYGIIDEICEELI